MTLGRHTPGVDAEIHKIKQQRQSETIHGALPHLCVKSHSRIHVYFNMYIFRSVHFYSTQHNNVGVVAEFQPTNACRVLCVCVWVLGVNHDHLTSEYTHPPTHHTISAVTTYG